MFCLLGGKDEDTALLRAVRSRNEECVRLLLDKGAKVSASDKVGVGGCACVCLCE